MATLWLLSGDSAWGGEVAGKQARAEGDEQAAAEAHAGAPSPPPCAVWNPAWAASQPSARTRSGAGGGQPPGRRRRCCQAPPRPAPAGACCGGGRAGADEERELHAGRQDTPGDAARTPLRLHSPALIQPSLHPSNSAPPLLPRLRTPHTLTSQGTLWRPQTPPIAPPAPSAGLR